MDEKDIKFLGFNIKYSRPEWLILTTFPVPPLHIRPSVFLPGSSSKSEDDLTYKLSDILKANLDLKASQGETTDKRKEKMNLLQYHLATYVNNELNNVAPSTQRGGRPLKTLRQRIKVYINIIIYCVIVIFFSFYYYFIIINRVNMAE